MDKKLRLVFPQWQGGLINSFFPDLPREEIAHGYHLGAMLLNYLQPGSAPVEIVPVTLENSERPVTNGISAKAQIIRQLQAAQKIIEVYEPEQILTIGGECSVSLAPFSYFAARDPDVAVLWIDAHTDLHMPGDDYTGFHAMALASGIGKGDEDIGKCLPGIWNPEKTMLVGLRNAEGIAGRMDEWGIRHVPTAHGQSLTEEVLLFLEKARPSKLLIHLDLDVLDPNHFRTAVGNDPDGLFMDDVVTLLNTLSEKYCIAALTIAEIMPVWAIRLRDFFRKLPLHDI